MNDILDFQNCPLFLFISLCVITIIQLLYFIYFFRRLAFYKPTQKNSSQTHAVSVVVCARDEANNLSKNLPGLLSQEYQATLEVVVVNDHSFDESKYILEEYKKQYKHLQVIELTQETSLIPGKKIPLAIGIKSARHEVLLLTDADCVPSTEYWINSMQKTYDDETEIVLGYGAFHKLKGFFNKIVRWECFLTALQYFSYALARLPYMGVGRNLSYKKSLFLKHKGFAAHNNISGGDDDLFIKTAANRHNTKINIDKNSFTLSMPAKNIKQWIRQKNRHYSTSKYYKGKHQFLLGTYALSQFLFYPLFISVAICYNWPYAISIITVKYIIQGIIFYPSMKKLNELDLFPFYIFFDIWMFFYYLIFAYSLIKKPSATWK